MCEKVDNLPSRVESYFATDTDDIAIQWREDVQKLLANYEAYLRENLQEQALLHSSGMITAVKKKAMLHNLMQAHYHLQHLSFLRNTGVIRTRKCICDCISHCRAVFSEPDKEKRHKLIETALHTASSLQEQCLRVVTSRLQVMVCQCSANFAEKQVFIFISDAGRDLLLGMRDSIDLFHQLECLSTILPETDRQAMLVSLRSELFHGLLYKNSALALEIWPRYHPQMAIETREELLCIQMILFPEKTVEVLEKLDAIDSSLEPIHNKLKSVLFQTLTANFNKNASTAEPASTEAVLLSIQQAIFKSFCDGWLLRQWFDFVRDCDGEPASYEHLLQQIQGYHRVLTFKTSAYQREKEKQQKELEVSLVGTVNLAKVPKVPKVSKKPAFQPRKSAIWEPAEPKDNTGPVISEEDRLFIPIEKEISERPLWVIDTFNDLIKEYKDNSVYCVRARVNQASAALVLLMPMLTRLTHFKKRAEKFCSKSTAALDRNNGEFVSHKLYKNIRRDFNAISDICQQLEELLPLTHHYIAEVNCIAVGIGGDDCSIMMASSCCKEAEVLMKEAFEVASLLKRCVDLRTCMLKKQLEYRKMYQLEKSNTLRKKAEENKDLFAVAADGLSNICGRLAQLIDATAMAGKRDEVTE